MGCRTTIIINNDHLDTLTTDLSIGRQIKDAILGFDFRHDGNIGIVGNVIEQAYADVARLMVIGAGGAFRGDVLASITFVPIEQDPVLMLLKQAADDLGYKLIKKSSRD
jgi:hypothetical protein